MATREGHPEVSDLNGTMQGTPTGYSHVVKGTSRRRLIAAGRASVECTSDASRCEDLSSDDGHKRPQSPGSGHIPPAASEDVRHLRKSASCRGPGSGVSRQQPAGALRHDPRTAGTDLANRWNFVTDHHRGDQWADSHHVPRARTVRLRQVRQWSTQTDTIRVNDCFKIVRQGSGLDRRAHPAAADDPFSARGGSLHCPVDRR